MDCINLEESHVPARRSGERVREEFSNLIGNLLETNGLEKVTARGHYNIYYVRSNDQEH